ncbi:NAD(P)-dependent alcohol dehydrogenase [Thermostaphylospora chromogena]|jgi:L-iditol 2-dehydrogenase|uniref:L-iditol 2-dehydrogenase n=1 Tax=Thermostaphylospora chromogena TaxID=35622 RepID=A0A1H1ES97_9ACTN|nr:NAD(P)-dependent alcohol dehydrogenase [Thermostaphylospora chromogena]SDQ91434.1 L-iditol 2-dehydrogenase [Thermostaphylospora chromogena]
MTTMQAAVLRGILDLAIEERPVPEPGPGEVLVQVNAVGVCGSDVHYYQHGRIGDFVVEQPMVLGHESGGVIVGVGPGVDRARIGQRVSIEPGVPDLTCPECLAGRYNLCPGMRFFATPPIDGSLAEYVTVHAAFAHPVPDSISDDAAALLEPLSVGVWASRKAGVSVGSRVLITGAGPIGLVAAQCARAFGASEIVVADLNPHRLRLAADLGATETLNVAETPLREAGLEPTVLLECSGHPGATADALHTLARAGRAVLVGMGDAVSLPLTHIQSREIEVTGTFRYANTWPTAIALAASGRVDVDSLVTGHFPLAESEAALLASERDPLAVKSVINPQN